MAKLAEDFKTALQTLEKEKSLDAVTGFFSEDATLERLTEESFAGSEGVERFWQEYLETFQTQTTTFKATHQTEDVVVLEWVSEGELPNGKPFSYKGVSVLEHGGEKIGAFRTYYDSAVFVSEK